MQAAIGPEYSKCDVNECYPVCRQIQTIVFTTMASFVSPSRKRPRTYINCIALGCTNYYGKDNTVHYHQVPADRIQAQERLNNGNWPGHPGWSMPEFAGIVSLRIIMKRGVFLMLMASLFWRRGVNQRKQLYPH